MSSVLSRVGNISALPTGATYDILLIDFPGGFPQSVLKFNINDTPRKVTGIQKVSQMFLKILFTSVGSNLLYQNQGTNFPNLVINANISSSDPVFISELSAEILSAASQTSSILNSSGDSASQLDTVTIIGLDVGQESAIMYLSILTMAGALAQVSVPFPQLDLVLNSN